MRAEDHTLTMLAWWRRWIHRADLAIRRPSGTMIWVRDRALDCLPLAWARAENSRGADIYARPARGYEWPLLFLDDLTVHIACKAARRYAALAVRTSPAGGCHLWLATSVALDEHQRRACQRHLAKLTGADPASTSGEHLGRLAGLRNHKRHGSWVNVISPATGQLPPWPPPASLLADACSCCAPRHGPARLKPPPRGHGDHSPSGQDWAWTCRQLQHGMDPEQLLPLLIQRCQARRGSDADRYARRTIRAASRHLAT